MSQAPVQLISTDDLDLSITLSVRGIRVEYLLGPYYYSAVSEVRQWLSNGWNNHAVAQLTWRASRIITHGRQLSDLDNPPWQSRVKRGKKMSTSIDHRTGPSKEYSFGVIAPTARNGLTYNGQRLWFKTMEDAKLFASEIFEGADKKNFELCIVQCIDIVSVKPTIELSSRW